MQSVFFISKDTVKYPKINENYTWVPIHNKFNFEEFSELYHKYKPLAIYTYGNDSNYAWDILCSLFRLRKIWVHLNDLPENIDVINNIYSGILGHQYDEKYPLFSIITTTFHSKEKILRPFRSLQAQSYKDWEWIIFDDSEDESKTFNELVELQKKDLRIRVYKSSLHSGVIGEMKRLACGVAYGKFLVEVDHDDDLHPDLLKWIYDASVEYPDATFFYTDCCELNEHDYKSVSYGDYFALGYSMHYNEWSDFHNCFITTCTAPYANKHSMSHIVGVPNHVRAWKTDFYDKIGKHNPLLSVADDYEIILRSFIEGKFCHIRKCGYYQYRNRDGNFTFIRNRLIQHNVFHVYNRYKNLLDGGKHYNCPQWKTDDPIIKENYEYILPEDRNKNVVVTNNNNIDNILEELKDFDEIYIINKIDTDIPKEYRHRVKWWDFSSKDVEDMRRYAEKFLKKGNGNFVVKFV